MIPELKKKVSDFLSSEEGRISRQSAVKLGVFGAGAVIAFASSVISAKADFYACRQNAGETPSQAYCTKGNALPNAVVHASHSSY